MLLWVIDLKKVVVINGSGAVGKDTFCELCNQCVPCKVISTVDIVKEAYKLLGWNGEKSDIYRKGLSDIKDISTETLDHPYKYVEKNIKEFYQDDTYEILFIHSREPNEINRIAKNYPCATLLIKNSRVNTITTNHADAEVDNFNYTHIVDNEGTLEDLKNSALKFIRRLGYYE